MTRGIVGLTLSACALVPMQGWAQAGTPASEQDDASSTIVVTAKSGALREQEIIDTPKTVSAIGSDLIKNLQPTILQDVTKYFSSLTPRTSATDPAPRYFVRGLDLADIYTRDGLYFADAFLPTSEIERVEVLAGMPDITQGGLVVPGGLVNFVPKRPAPGLSSAATVGTDHTGSLFSNADFNLVETDATFGLRANVEARRLRRTFGHTRGSDLGFAIAGLARLGPDVTLEANLSYRRFASDNDDNRSYPIINRTRVPQVDYDDWYGADWAKRRQTRLLGEVKLSGDFDSGWTFTFKGHAFNYNIDATNVVYSASATASTATQQLATASGQLLEQHYRHVYAVSGLVTKRFDIGANVTNTIALVADATRIPQLLSNSTIAIRTVDLSAPEAARQLARPAFATPVRLPSNTRIQSSYGVGDELTLFDRLTVSGNIRRYDYELKTYRTGVLIVPTTTINVWLPSVAALFKVQPRLSLYATYGEAAEGGGIAGLATAVNFGQPLGPIQSKAYEAGVKWGVLGGLATVSAFKIDRPSETFINNVQAYTGNTVYKGVDASLQSRIADKLTLIGNLQYLDAKVEEARDLTVVGKTPTNVPKFSASAYAEYEAVPGLFVSGGIQHVGRKPVYDTDTLYAPAFTLFDAGVRYSPVLEGRAVDIRLNITNIGDRYYLVSTRFNQGTLGQPRMASLSVSTRF